MQVPTDQCDLCADRVEKGKLPTCVKHCQAGCMQYGSVEELSKNARPGAMFFEVTEVRPLG